MDEKLMLPEVYGLTLLDLEKNAFEIESLWRDRRIVMTFLRHFG